MAEGGLRVRRGQGLAVVFIHGNGVDHRSLLPLDGVFGQLGGFERIYLDLPGFGGSPALPAPGGLPEYVRWLVEQIDEAVGRAPFALVGQSMGGLLAQDVAFHRAGQVQGLALLAPVTYPVAADRDLPGRRVVSEDQRLMARLEARDREAYAELSVVRSTENWERFRRSVLPGIRAANLRAMARLAQRYDLQPLPVHRQGTASFPVLALCGEEDQVVGYRDALDLQHRYRNFHRELVPRAGHNLHIDQPAVVDLALRTWALQVRDYAARQGPEER
ncbi:alpha/beta hydrolase [Glutamicibacter sp. MNS18]|uniref:alpha/beta fold hydrolase n=1 Tax=Glutamicibacter sp. MNS18 TaxID=2989817 RepID=UPI0022355C63|nr:alpha/beta hydrolase [Glutamicibacter sp. MNS18]MCW4464301.1 alpha/beta hydrolase [Glutamicibacter sp. MNS18]